MTIKTAGEYLESLKDRHLKIHMFGEQVKAPLNHPIIRPSINSVAMTYELACRTVCYLTESMHGVGSPQAQRIMVTRMVDVEARKEMVKQIAGIKG